MEEESVPVDENQVPGEVPREETRSEDTKRPAEYPSYLLDTRLERLYGIDPWGNDWGE